MQGINSIINTNTQYQYPHKTKLNTNTIDIDDKTKGHIDIEATARQLMAKLRSNEGSLEFFCMALHKLPHQTVFRLAGLAGEPGVRNPGAYFNVLVRRELAK